MDVVSYNTLMKAYLRHNLFDQACNLLTTMRRGLRSCLRPRKELKEVTRRRIRPIR